MRCLFLLVLAVALSAAEPPAPRQISLLGRSERVVAPDTARIRAAVSATVDGEPAAAAAALDAAIARLRDEVAAAGVAPEATAIGHLALVTSEPDKSARKRRLTASRRVEIAVADLAAFDRVVLALAARDDVRANSTTFSVKDAAAIRAAVIGEAATDARTRADAIARAAGTTVTVLDGAEITENPTEEASRGFDSDRPVVRGAGSSSFGSYASSSLSVELVGAPPPPTLLFAVSVQARFSIAPASP